MSQEIHEQFCGEGGCEGDVDGAERAGRARAARRADLGVNNINCEVCEDERGHGAVSGVVVVDESQALLEAAEDLSLIHI